MLLSKTISSSRTPLFIVEDVAAQKWLIQELKRKDLSVEAFKVSGVGKDDRLRVAALALETGKVFFHKTGCKDLLTQLTGFHSETYNDLADAFSALILKIREKNYVSDKLYAIEIIETRFADEPPKGLGNIKIGRRNYKKNVKDDFDDDNEEENGEVFNCRC